MPPVSPGELAHDTHDDGQAETIAFLQSEKAFGEKPLRPPIATHISLIFLYAQRAIKLKRAVHFPYVDFSTPALRLAACERELALNRRTAPTLYSGVRRITRDNDGSLQIDGKGPLVDAVVDMRRFDDDALLAHHAEQGGLPIPLLTKLAQTIATFHRAAETVANGRDDETATARLARIIDLNEAAFASNSIIPAQASLALAQTFRARLAALASLLDHRAKAGKIRHCHGDLHLRNICLLEGEPTLFDCLEFDDDMARVDILYDLAFLLMDLWHRGLAREANWIFNRYLDQMDEDDGLTAMPFFMALRAAIRAHVAATLGRSNEALSYFALAQALLHPRPAALVSIGGLSGTGKSTLAAALAPAIGPAPGARVLSSDRIRKGLFGVRAETRLPPEAYAPEVSARVYARITTLAETILHLGQGVVADAVFDRMDDRAEIERVAAKGNVPFLGFWLETSLERQIERVEARRNDASDADATIVLAQRDRDTGAIQWHHLVSDHEATTTARQALEICQARLECPA
ncbi:AAA family ATPase [Beijerinckia indica]|uniref:Aminoglycoside phosphotransferase domain-containing protein n=1 Tax=Beijerinckia indica subsp. indica (strain ATCC 9039 / DSM 1715 / NCIMB 8712) TaxID=395963 RepID=B2IGS8_BEII9|nr:AAA family ATPase [Beijerinckia indica]ACB95839.1 conserved hypothetical protein [Beijerinckia indica subsp. indica ATCC 9039]